MSKKNSKHPFRNVLIVIGMILIILNFATGIGNLSTVTQCGTVNATFHVTDADTGNPIAGASISTPYGSAVTDGSGNAAINGIQTSTATTTITISATSYFSTNYPLNCVGSAGQTQSMYFPIYMDPLSIINIGTTTQTFQSVTSSTLTTTQTLTSTLSSSGSLSTVTQTTVETSTTYLTSNITIAPLVTTITTTNFFGQTQTTTSFVYVQSTSSHSLLGNFPLPVLSILGFILIILGILL